MPQAFRGANAAASLKLDSLHFFAGNEFRKSANLSRMHKTVYLSLGSNLGDRAANLQSAIEKLSELGNVVAVSSFYETEPVETAPQPWFLNCAIKLDTEKMPRQLIAAILSLEQSMGRQHRQEKAPRTIDIDILLFGSSVVELASLTIPHPRMHERRFVMEPLAEIAPDARHPVFKRTIRELRDALPAGQHVKKLVSS
jgi:2-amino-4-hydroxy-6-hydroxymethyldihydropteridine diphosphokinase